MKDGSIDLAHLRFFRILLETGALNRAAERLGLSHAASSRALERLRHVFDDKLFLKTGSGMVPTPRAIALQPRVISVLAELEGLLAADDFDPAVTTRNFHIGAVDNSFLMVCGDVIAEFVRRAPNANLEFHSLDDDFLDQLKDGRLDVAVYGRNSLPPDFHKLELLNHDFVCLARNGHPLTRVTAAGQPPRMSEFQRYRRIGVKIQCGTDAKSVEADAVDGVLPGGLAVRTPYFISSCALLRKTDLLLIMPRRTATLFAEAMDLVVLPLPCPSRELRVGLVWHHRVHNDPALIWLRQLFAERYPAEDPAAGPRRAVALAASPQ